MLKHNMKVNNYYNYENKVWEKPLKSSVSSNIHGNEHVTIHCSLFMDMFAFLYLYCFLYIDTSLAKFLFSRYREHKSKCGQQRLRVHLALHKICENTGKYGSVKTRIVSYFM